MNKLEACVIVCSDAGKFRVLKKERVIKEYLT